MKRLNPKTNLPFKYGDIREDGYVFSTYKLTELKKNGFFRERWVCTTIFKKLQLKNIKRSTNYRKTNLCKIKKIKKNYRKNHKDKIYSDAAKRRATKLNATPQWLTDDHKKQITKIYKNCLKISEQTGVQHHVDHIIPLKGKEVCGLHVPWNLQILTATENISKNNKLIEH